MKYKTAIIYLLVLIGIIIFFFSITPEAKEKSTLHPFDVWFTDEGEPVAGCTVQVYAASDIYNMQGEKVYKYGDFVSQNTSDYSGHIGFMLFDGIYMVTERLTPDGYISQDTVKDIVIQSGKYDESYTYNHSPKVEAVMRDRIARGVDKQDTFFKQYFVDPVEMDKKIKEQFEPHPEPETGGHGTIYSEDDYQKMLGDINGDGKINSTDSLCVLRYCVRDLELNKEQQSRADMNGDGVLDSSDALEILKRSVKQ